MSGYNVAVVGASGAVGREMLKTLEARDFPVKSIKLFARSTVGSVMYWRGEPVVIEAPVDGAFRGVDIALFSAGGEASRVLAPRAAAEGCVVVDNSSCWRMDESVPLVIPEVNVKDLAWHRGIIANPNCSTIQMLVALKPLHDAFRIKRVVVSTYQAVSGTGHKAVKELTEQTEAFVSGAPIESQVYPRQIAFNVLPHIDSFLDNGYTKEEMKMVNETHKILDPSIRVSATTVRVPVFRGHSESVNIETELPCSVEAARRALRAASGVLVMDDPAAGVYPTALDSDGRDEVFVGRIRKDDSVEHGLNLWCVSDNLRKGAALNAVQIAEAVIAGGLLIGGAR